METKLPSCKLIGTDGNAFSIIGNVSSCLKKAGLREEAKKFTEEAFSSGSYNEVLQLAMKYVNVK